MVSRTFASLSLLLAGLGASAADAASPPPAYAVTGRIAGADGGWDYASVDPASGRLYVARSNAVMMVDLATAKVTDTFVKAQRAHAVLPIDKGRTLVETDGQTGLVRFIDAATGKVRVEVPTGIKPDAAFLDSATGRLVVMNPGSNTVVLLDPVQYGMVGRIDVPGGLEAGAGDGKGKAFVNLEEANALAEIDLVAGKLIRTIPLKGCEGPTGIAVLGGGSRILSACANGVATVVDAASGALVQTLPVGHDPDAVIVDEARGMAFVPSGQDGTLTMIRIADPAHFTVTGTIRTQAGARTGAVDPRDGRIYLPTALMARGEGGSHHGAAEPGTFVVLVVSPTR